MATTGVGTAAVFIPELWSELVQKAREDNLVAAKSFYDVSGFGEIKSKGDILHIPLISNLTATTKTVNTELPSTATTENEVTLTVDTHEGIRVQIEDITRAQSSYDLMRLYTEKIGYGLAVSLDSSLLALYSGLSQTVGATASSDPGIAYTNIVSAAQQLDEALVPMQGRFVIIDSYGAQDMRLITEFTRYDAAGQAGNKNAFIGGKIGTVLGMDVMQSENLSTSSVVGGTLSRGLVAHKEAFIHASQMKAELEQWRNAPYLTDEVIGQTLYGVAEYRDNHGVVLSYPQA